MFEPVRKEPRDVRARVHAWVANGEDWFIRDGGMVFRAVLITWAFGLPIWLLTDSRGMAAYGLVFSCMFEVYRNVTRQVSKPRTLWMQVKAFMPIVLMILLMLVAPLIYGLALELIDKKIIIIEHVLLQAIFDVLVITFLAVSIVSFSIYYHRCLDMHSLSKVAVSHKKRFVLLTAPILIFFVVFLLFPLNYCLIRLGGCDNAALVQTMYQLDGRIRPLGIEHGLFLFVPSAAMGDQSRYEELQIVYFKWASVFFPFLSLIVFPMFLPLWRDWWRSRLDRKG